MDRVVIDRGELQEALAASREAGHSRATHYVADHLARHPADEAEIELDLSGGISWEAFLQDILRRSPRLRYVTAVSSFLCSRMRSDGFGGLVVLITAESILAKSTTDMIAGFLKKASLEA